MKIKADKMCELEKFGFEKVSRKIFFSDEISGWQYAITEQGSEIKIFVHDKDSETGECGEINCGGTDKFPMFGVGLVSFDKAAEIYYKLITAGMVEL